MRKIFRTTLFLAIAALAVMGIGVAAQDNGPDPLERAREATVFLMQTYEVGGGRQGLSCVGSGTLVSSSGLILTNAHLAQPGGPCRGERVIVALAVRTDEPPVPTYVADVVQIDERMDLAVLRITGGLDGSQISPNALNLPFVELGNSAELSVGSALTFAGYPTTGTASVATVDGTLTGTTIERSTRGSGAWFRTDADLGGGISGGGAYNADGELIGIPTSSPATDGTQLSESCIAIQDSTGDGLISERDTCVPIGAPVSAIRPVQFAAPLVDAARLGFELSHAPGFPQGEPAGPPVFERLLFSTGVDAQGNPTRLVTALPAGASSLYLFFDYDNMTFGTPYSLRVIRDGVEDPKLGLGPLAWGGGKNGMWYIGTEGLTWPSGNYQFELLANDEVIAAATITIGGSELDSQVFSDVTFGIENASFQLSNPGGLLPATVTRIDAQFAFSGMANEQPWTEIWYIDGTEVSNNVRLWDNGPSGQITVNASNGAGLPIGRYRLELYIGERLAATGDVRLAGAPNPDNTSRIFTDPLIANDITQDGLPTGQTGSVMPLGTSDLLLFMDWEQMPVDTLWTYRWFLDGRLIASQTQRWDAGGIGQNYWVQLTADDTLPEGAYAVEILVENRPMFSELVTIGSGTRPGEAPEAQEDDVFITGTVVDALTGEGIPSALVIILDVALESPLFTWYESDIHTQAVTDRTGRFELPVPVKQANFYTTYVFAEGYVTIVEDNFTIPGDQESPTDIVIEMNHP